MRILIIEDTPRKSSQLREFVESVLPGAIVEERRSYQSGLRAAQETRADVVLLDMTMPTFDRSEGDAGGRTRPFAGREILRELRRKGIAVTAIIVTGFETFGESEQRTTLDELKSELTQEFPESYRGTVYYNSRRADWRPELKALLLRSAHEND